MECETSLKSGMTGEQLLSLALDMGERMIISGAEANRVEDTILRICTSYGCTKVDVFSITSYLSVTITKPDGTHDTQTRRIHSYSNNLDRLEHLNAISRYICVHVPAYDNIEAEIASIRRSKDFPWYVTIFGYFLSSGAFAIFFGGSLRDGLVAAALSQLAYIMDIKIRPLNINMLIYYFFCTFLLGVMARIIGLTGFIDNLDKVFIGLVMLYIPGTQMTNSIRDILCGDIMSGLLRLIEAVILAIAIALGFATSIVGLNMFF